MTLKSYVPFLDFLLKWIYFESTTTSLTAYTANRFLNWVSFIFAKKYLTLDQITAPK